MATLSQITALQNGIKLGWAQMRLSILGKLSVAVTDISFKLAQTKEHQYGLGDQPIALGLGNIEYTFSLTFHQEEVNALRKASPTGFLTGIHNAEISMTHGDPALGQEVTSMRITNVAFMDDGVEMSQGDTATVLQVNAMGIIRQIVAV